MSDQQQYPTGVDPELVKNGEFQDDGTVQDNDLKQAEAEEHIDYIRKVLGIVTVQMTATFALCALSSASPSFGNFFKNPLILILSFFLMMSCTCVIFASPKRRQTVPENYFWLAGATVGEAFFLAAVAADLTVMSVFTAIMGTCFAVAGLFVAALYTASSVDREVLIRNMVKGLIICLCLNVFMLLFMMFSFQYQDKGLVFAVGVIMCIIAGAYIMFALLFVIVPGLEENGRDDYILGALRLYLEIARLFFWLMKILGEKK